MIKATAAIKTTLSTPWLARSATNLPTAEAASLRAIFQVTAQILVEVEAAAKVALERRGCCA